METEISAEEQLNQKHKKEKKELQGKQIFKKNCAYLNIKN